MSMHDLHEGMGQTGKLGEGFLVLGILAAIGGAILTMMGGLLMWPEKNSGASVHVDSITSGLLFLVMGLGFATFAVMIMMAGWARHHPGYDEHGAHPTDAQHEE